MAGNSPLLRTLPYAGALPFIGCAGLLIFGVKNLPALGTTKAIMMTYGLTIVSFMAGVQWGEYLAGVRGALNLLLTSNAVALAAWFGFLLLPSWLFSLLLVLLFAALYAIDALLHPRSDYLQARRNVTLVVSACLLLSAYL
jgi:Protein of unknown function (DUF3429)